MKTLLIFLLLPFLAFAQEIANIDTLYGSELVSNGSFDTELTGWSNYGGSPTFEWVETGGGFTGALHIIADQNDGVQRIDLSVTAGNTYRLMVDYYKEDTKTTRGVVRTSVFEPGLIDISTAGAFSLDTVFVAQNTDASTWIWVYNASSGSSEFYLDNVSLREITGYDTTYASDNRPLTPYKTSLSTYRSY